MSSIYIQGYADLFAVGRRDLKWMLIVRVFPEAAVTKCTNWLAYNNVNLLSRSSRGQKSEIMTSAGPRSFVGSEKGPFLTSSSF